MLKKLKDQIKKIMIWYKMRKIAKSMTEYIEVPNTKDPLKSFKG